MEVKIKDLFAIPFSLLVLLGLSYLERSGIQIPILRQAIAFSLLTFIPGFLVLGILRLDGVSIVEKILYSVGISLFFLMFTGVVVNILYPVVGISKPISETPLLITVSIAVLILFLICYSQNKYRSRSVVINTTRVFSLSTLSLSLLPFLAIFGTYLLNFYDNNILLLILLAVISAIPILVVLNKTSRDKYPLAIWMISISLLLHNSLIGQYVSWGDAEAEYLISNLVLRSGFWDTTIPTTHNSLLGITILYPYYSLICNIELTWVFKVVYPLLFSLTPLSLYLAIMRQTDEKIAFLASCLFMFSYMFFTLLSRNTRTGLSLLFLSLLILLLTDKNLKPVKKATLSVVFLLSIGVVYYGVSYILLLILLPVALLHFLDKKSEDEMITPTFASLFIVFSIVWYMYTSNSYGFNILVNFGINFLNQLGEFVSAPRSSPIFYLIEKWSISLEVVKYLYVITEFFIAMGILDLMYKIIKSKQIRFSRDYSFLSIFFFLFLSASIYSLPGNVQRILQISLVFLAPFCVIGCIRVFNIINFKYSIEKNTLKFFSIFLLLLFVFDSGLISATITHDLNPNQLINKPLITKASTEEKGYFYSMCVPRYDLYYSEWLLNNTNGTIEIYGIIRWFYTLSKPEEVKSMFEETKEKRIHLSKLSSLKRQNKVDSRSYICLGYCAYKEGLIIEQYPLVRFNRSEIDPVLNSTYKIYDNGGSVIYYES